MADFGTVLKAAREEQGLTLEEVASATYIRQHLLDAMENNDLKSFPSPVIARGLIRNYAKYLNLDPVAVLTLYDGKGIVPIKGQRLTAEGIEFMDLSMAPRPFLNLDLIFGVVLFIFVVSAGSYLFYSSFVPGAIAQVPTSTPFVANFDDDLALPLATTTPQPTATPTLLPPTETPTPIYGGVNVELNFRQSSWVQILVDDVKAFEGVVPQGETRQWTGLRRVAIRAGNAGGVEVSVNGQLRGLMGTENQVVDQVWEKVDDPALIPTATPVPPDGGSNTN